MSLLDLLDGGLVLLLGAAGDVDRAIVLVEDLAELLADAYNVS